MSASNTDDVTSERTLHLKPKTTSFLNDRTSEILLP